MSEFIFAEKVRSNNFTSKYRNVVLVTPTKDRGRVRLSIPNAFFSVCGVTCPCNVKIGFDPDSKQVLVIKTDDKSGYRVSKQKTGTKSFVTINFPALSDFLGGKRATAKLEESNDGSFLVRLNKES